MLPVKFHKPLHVKCTSYHIKRLNGCSTNVIVKAASCSYVYLAKSSNFLDILETSKIRMFLLRLSTALSTEEVENRLYLLFCIQNFLVTNSKRGIAENVIALYV